MATLITVSTSLRMKRPATLANASEPPKPGDQSQRPTVAAPVSDRLHRLDGGESRLVQDSLGLSDQSHVPGEQRVVDELHPLAVSDHPDMDHRVGVRPR